MAFLPPAAQYLFSEYQASLANGAEIDSGWLDMQTVDKYQIEAAASALGMDVVITSSTASGGGEADVSTTTTTDTTFFLTNLIVRQRYIRFQFQNNTGGLLTDVALSIKATYGSSDKMSVFPLSIDPSNFSQAALVRAVNSGQQPDGDYVNNKQDGVAVETTSTLAADATYTSAWVDTDGWNTVDLYVTTTVPSAEQGIEIEFTDDTSGTPTVRGSVKYEFTAQDIQNGFKNLRIATMLDGVRLKYTNGAQAQSSFYASLTLRTEPENLLYNNAGAQITSTFGREIALGAVDNFENEVKFGRNPDIDSGPEDIWANGGNYTGFNATGNENIAVSSSSAADTGTVVSSGTATGGSSTTIVDTGATFSTDGVAAGDVVVNDTNGIHGVVTTVDSETQLTVFRMTDGERGEFTNVSGDAYRVVTTGSTGAALIKLDSILDENFAKQTPKYVVLNGTSTVTVTVSAMRCSNGSVILAGSGGTGAGTITVTQAVTTANVFIAIPSGFDSSLVAATTVPAGESWLIAGVRTAISRANAGAGSATVTLRVRRYGEVFRSIRSYEVTTASDINVKFDTGILLSTGTDMKWRVDSVGSTNTVAEASTEFIKLIEQ